ncbi:hypothetical protein FGO68_gene6905 [Halteria grandinella]|uniref:RING-type domain-containing protein n=1 Tax=Halteria grandinella TaxID=5974 RepID=A0A8J8T6W3_HALGN|nr:hypothetical protein FGO68_gene6905 [Halteria grandinella]
MQRSKPYRQRPTPAFMNLLEIAQNMRMYLVQETGPTKLVLEDAQHHKYKIQVGSDISCSCGGGKEEHCVHTIFAMLKIYRIGENDPMVWQLSFIDAEISKIIQNRHSYGRRHAPTPPKEDSKKANPALKKAVARMKLEEGGEECCICFDTMNDQQQHLTYCKHQCGRNIHADCIEIWIKNKTQSAQKITCPLCRVDWGANALEDLQKEKQEYRQRRAEEATKKHEASGTALQLNNDRSFKCYCCKRTLIYEAKLQCIVCPQVEVCKLCFSGKYHDHHEFIMRPAPEKEWEPAYRPGQNPNQFNDEYQRVMRELQTREIQPEDYELLLSLEQRGGGVSLYKFLAVSYDKMLPPEKKAEIESLRETPKCQFCETPIAN